MVPGPAEFEMSQWRRLGGQPEAQALRATAQTGVGALGEGAAGLGCDVQLAGQRSGGVSQRGAGEPAVQTRGFATAALGFGDGRQRGTQTAVSRTFGTGAVASVNGCFLILTFR